MHAHRLRRSLVALAAALFTLFTVVGAGTGPAAAFSSGSSSTLDVAPPQSVPQPDSDQPYWDRQNWGWLEYPGALLPGGLLANTRTGATCSAGYLVGHDNKDYVLTSGHCGQVGDSFTINDAYGNYREIGYIEYRQEDPGVDYSLIRLTDYDSVSAALPLDVELAGWISTDQLMEMRPELCRLGYRSGLSCGPLRGLDRDGRIHFTAIANHGDSGGPVFAIIGGKAYAVGITTGGFAQDATLVVADPIDRILAAYGLHLYGRNA